MVDGSVGPTMTSTPDPLPRSGADDPAAVLAAARAAKEVEDDAARVVLQAAARWAAMHSTDSLVEPGRRVARVRHADGWRRLPAVAEFAVIEFAAAIGRSTDSAAAFSHAVEGHYRLAGAPQPHLVGRTTLHLKARDRHKQMILPLPGGSGVSSTMSHTVPPTPSGPRKRTR